MPIIWVPGRAAMSARGALIQDADNVTISLHFNAHFPGGPGLASTRMSPFWILLELRMMEVVVTNGAIRRGKFQSNHHHQQTNTIFLHSTSIC